MAEATTRSERPLEEHVTLALGEVLDLDVAYCDLVHASEPNPFGPFDLRFRGTRQPDGTRVRLRAARAGAVRA